MTEPKVLLATLSIRTSAKTGRPYVTGWLGKSRLIGFSGEPDKFGNRTIDVFLQAVPEQPEHKPGRELAAVNVIDAMPIPPNFQEEPPYR